MKRSGALQFVLFAGNGGLVAIVYSILVWTFIAWSPDRVAVDVVVAYAFSAVFNYLGARFIFKPVTSIRGHVHRYLTVLGGNFLVTAGIAWVLDDLGAAHVVSAYAPVIVTAIPTFLLMRSWVFRDPPRPAPLP